VGMDIWQKEKIVYLAMGVVKNVQNQPIIVKIVFQIGLCNLVNLNVQNNAMQSSKK